MSSFRTHARDSCIAAAVSAVGVGALVAPVAGLLAGVGALTGIVLTPDLDQQSISRSEHRLVKYTLGLGFFWLMYWWLYAVAIPHRSKFSHAPILGTAIRLLCLFPLWYLLFRLELLGPWLLPFAVGLALSDAAHWVRDSL